MVEVEMAQHHHPEVGWLQPQLLQAGIAVLRLAEVVLVGEVVVAPCRPSGSPGPEGRSVEEDLALGMVDEQGQGEVDQPAKIGVHEAVALEGDPRHARLRIAISGLAPSAQ